MSFLLNNTDQRIPKWLRSYGLAILLTLACVGVLAFDKAMQGASVRLSSYNYTQQSIYYFTVNGAMGANVIWGEPEGGGKTTCCAEIKGNTVQIKWQIDRIDKDEIYERVVSLPPRPTKPPKYLEVHFFPNQEIKLRWSDWPREPMQPIQPSPEFLEEKAQELKAKQERHK